jgi:hypothetical protein
MSVVVWSLEMSNREVFMNRKCGFFVLLIAMLSAAPVFAAGQTLGSLTVARVSTGWGAEGVYVSTLESLKSAEGCGPGFMIAADHPMLKIMTALLLTAQTTGQKVDLYVDGCLNPNGMKLKAVSLSR